MPQLNEKLPKIRDLPLLAYRVESEAQVHALSQKRVDYLQGFAVRDVMTLDFHALMLNQALMFSSNNSLLNHNLHRRRAGSE